ncbi:MAG: prephenate dehydrogenase [Desulfitobacteriaceae bacterium]
MPAVKADGLLSPGWLGQRRPRACIIGLGLIGGSWAGALHKRGWWVAAVDSSAQGLEQAQERGWIEEGYSEIPATLDIDLVILALPLSFLMSGRVDLAGKVSPGAIVTDVGSLKEEICRYMPEYLGQQVSFIGGHPMTGSEKSGFDAANPELFNGFPYVLIPMNCPENAVASLEGLVESCGAHVVRREAERHDIEVAMVSHIPHLLALALTLAAQNTPNEEGTALQLAGRSFREGTRVVESSPAMWKEIMVKNSEAILSGLELWQKHLDELRTFIEEKDGESIAEAFRLAAKIRQKM